MAESDLQSDFLWTSHAITQVSECIADPSKLRVVCELSDDISPVFPYLNAVYSNVMFNPGAGSLTLRRDDRILTFYARVALLAKVESEEDADAQLEWFRGVCNVTWGRRAEITPLYERRTLLGPLDAYQLLPKLNCRACGEATCMAFGVALLQGRRALRECAPLGEPAYAEGGRRLGELLGTPVSPGTSSA